MQSTWPAREVFGQTSRRSGRQLSLDRPLSCALVYHPSFIISSHLITPACFIFVKSKKWYLIFLYTGKPTIDYFPKSVYTVNETNNITMVCGADGVPKPTITWKKISSGRIVGEGEKFHIVTASKTDGDVYICFAQNELGDDSKGVTLQVQSKSVAG